MIREWIWEIGQQAFIDERHERVDGFFGEEGEWREQEGVNERLESAGLVCQMRRN
jgi:hypothetical protein